MLCSEKYAFRMFMRILVVPAHAGNGNDQFGMETLHKTLWWLRLYTGCTVRKLPTNVLLPETDPNPLNAISLPTQVPLCAPGRDKYVITNNHVSSADTNTWIWLNIYMHYVFKMSNQTVYAVHYKLVVQPIWKRHCHIRSCQIGANNIWNHDLDAVSTVDGRNLFWPVEMKS